MPTDISVNTTQPSTGGNFLSSLNNPDSMAGMRMAVPVIKSFESLQGVKDAYQFANQARQVWNATPAGLGGAYGAYGGYGGYAGGVGGFGNGVGNAIGQGMNGIGNAISNSLQSLPGLLKTNFLISGVMSLLTNTMDLFAGKVNGTQFLADTVADTVAYTGIGAGATMIGAAVGSIVPGIGTLVGMGVGALVGFLGGKLYETNIRPGFTQTLQQQFAGMSTPAGTAAPAAAGGTAIPGPSAASILDAQPTAPATP